MNTQIRYKKDINESTTLYLFDTNLMKKNSKICFRTSDEIKNALIDVASENKITLSILIEDILKGTIKKKKKHSGEKRKFPRKTEHIPIVIHGTNNTNYYYHSGEIENISLGGIRIRIPKNCKCRIRPDDRENLFEILFKISQTDEPIIIACTSRHFEKDSDGVIIGAAFQEAELHSYQKLQAHLLSTVN